MRRELRGKCIAATLRSGRCVAAQRASTQRLLTIELDHEHRAVQIRGFANRRPHANEPKLLERWAKARAGSGCCIKPARLRAARCRRVQ